MQWRTPREKQIAVELGFVLTASNRNARVVNIHFEPKDADHNSPVQGNVRPASSAEVKMWRMLNDIPLQ